MKVNSVLWLYALSVVFLCIFEFGSSSTTSVGRPPTSSTAATIAVNTKINRKPSKISSAPGRGVSSSNGSIIKINNTTESIGRRSKSRGSSRTSVSRPTSLPLFDTTNGREKKAIRQLEIPTNRKKNTTPKKYTTEGKFSTLHSTAGPTRVDFPKPTFSLPEKRSTKIPKKQQLICPKENEVKFDLFPRKCERNKDCNSRTSNELCCSIFGAKSCVGGLPRPLEESTHSPIFGIIPRHCPQRPLAELWWEVKTCETDMDCWPRVCCPDGQMRYCRSSKPELDIVPVPVKRSINYLSEYLECTPAPPPIFDLHPKPCNSTIDCFPNICCQEAGKKHCRPPKKSVLTFMANFLNVGLVKRLTKNLVIK